MSWKGEVLFYAVSGYVPYTIKKNQVLLYSTILHVLLFLLPPLSLAIHGYSSILQILLFLLPPPPQPRYSTILQIFVYSRDFLHNVQYSKAKKAFANFLNLVYFEQLLPEKHKEDQGKTTQPQRSQYKHSVLHHSVWPEPKQSRKIICKLF